MLFGFVFSALFDRSSSAVSIERAVRAQELSPFLFLCPLPKVFAWQLVAEFPQHDCGHLLLRGLHRPRCLAARAFESSSVRRGDWCFGDLDCDGHSRGAFWLLQRGGKDGRYR